MLKVLVLCAGVFANSAICALSLADELKAVKTEPLKSTDVVSVPEDAIAEVQPRAKRVLLVTSPACPGCLNELRRLEAPGGPFELLRNRGWKIGAGPDSHIQMIDQSAKIESDIEKVVGDLHPVNSPVVVYVENGAIARSFHGGCTTPLDQWTFGWLMTGNDQRPVPFQPEAITVSTTGNYPLRGNHWSVEGEFNPSRDYIIQHLRSTHSGYLQTSWNIESWSKEELLSAHDDIHDRTEGFRGRYSGSGSSSSSKSSHFSNAPSKASGGYRTPSR